MYPIQTKSGLALSSRLPIQQSLTSKLCTPKQANPSDDEKSDFGYWQILLRKSAMTDFGVWRKFLELAACHPPPDEG
jgi:hypothetical protein